MFFPPRRGDEHPGSKLTNDQRRQVRDLFRQGQTPRDLGRRFHVHPETIRRVGRMPSDWLK